VPGFFGHVYAQEVLGRSDLSKEYYYLVGYCPVAFHDRFAVARTLLNPGMKGTPEYRIVRQMCREPDGTPRAYGVREKELWEKVGDLSAASLGKTLDFSLIKRFHDGGIPQVRQMSLPNFGFQ